ncbi:MAG: extracellular solute-binding protein [Clostridia bacterium]|nr:extracellular solute-binding protein [Clostridia bacterium]
MMLKKTIALVVSAALLFSFAGCGKTNDNPAQSSSTQNAKTESTAETKKEVTLKVWHNYLPEVQKALSDTYAEFQQETGIKVEFVKLEDFDNKVEKAAQTGELPDLIIKANDSTGKLSVMGAITPIDDIVDATAMSGLMPNAVEGFKYQDKLYGVPAVMECVTLIYNKDLISEAPATTDDLINKVKEITKDGKYGFLIPPKDPFFNSAFFYGAGGGYLDKDGNAVLNSPENLEAAKILVELSKYYPKDLDHQLVSQLFRDGKAAMMISGPWDIPKIKEAKINYGMAKIPGVTKTGKSTPFMAIQGMYMTTKCKDKDAAAKVLNFFAGSKVSKAMAKAGGYLPANTEARSDSEITGNTDVAAFMSQSEVGISMPNVPEMGAMWTPLDGTLQEIVVLKQDPAKVLEKYQKKAEEAIKNMK